MSKWVPIAERLPEPFVQIALLDASTYMNTPDEVPEMHIIQVGYLEPRFAITLFWDVYGARRALCIESFTHWCELPDFDKEELK